MKIGAKFKFKVFHIYYCLAAFDILMLGASLIINHFNVQSFEKSIAINNQFVKLSDSAEKLTELAALTNAPGNDVFDSRDVDKERGRLNAAVTEYKAYHSQFVTEVSASAFGDGELSVDGPSSKDKLAKILRDIDSSQTAMLAVADAIFNNFAQGDEKAAGSKMATMDQKFAVLNKDLSRLRVTLHQMQEHDLRIQGQAVQQASRYEKLLGFVIIFMVVGVTWFGHVMGKKSDQQENALRQNSKMVALGEMAGGVAHEINNPLAVINMKASQLRRLISAGRYESGQAISFLQHIEDTTMRISKIVSGLKSFSRKSNNEPKTILLMSKMLNDITALSQDRFKNAGVKFEVINKTDFEITCRPVQIEQVLLNLVNNAFDAVQGSENPWVKIESKQNAKTVEISVTDSGKGIPAKIVQKMMQPFFTTKPVGKGTGLGLSISVGIAEAHGGTLTYNPVSRNTQFVLVLPKSEAISSQEPKAA